MTTHPNMQLLTLQGLLGVPGLYDVASLIATLHRWTTDNAPTGCLVPFTNKTIARGAGWTRHEPNVLIEALVRSRWLFRCPSNGLQVREWPRRASVDVHRAVAAAGQTFADGTEPDPAQFLADIDDELDRRISGCSIDALELYEHLKNNVEPFRRSIPRRFGVMLNGPTVSLFEFATGLAQLLAVDLVTIDAGTLIVRTGRGSVANRKI